MKQLIVKATLAAPTAISWLHSTEEARILGVFNRSCTLIREDGELISLVTADIGPGPFAMVVESNVALFFSSIGTETGVTIHNGCLSLDWLLIDATGVEIWNPQPDWHDLSADMILTNLLELTEILIEYGSPDSLVALLTGNWLNQAQQQINEAWQLLAKSFGELDLSERQDQLSQIAGLGGGLTPAGDDFLLGVLIALHCLVPISQAEQIAGDVVRVANGRTTKLSMAWLAAAARGEVAEPWHEFVRALVSNNPARVKQACLRILDIGQTSGSDAFTGFLLAGGVLAESHSIR